MTQSGHIMQSRPFGHLGRGPHRALGDLHRGWSIPPNGYNSRHVRAIPWPSGRWHARRRIDTRRAGRLHGRKRARGARTATLPWRGGRGVGNGVPPPPPQRRSPAGMAQRPRAGPSPRRAAHLLAAGGAADTAHGRAGGTDRRATKYL